MQNSAIPLKWYIPFAQNDAAKVEIPVTTTDATRASQSLGFPPLTMQPPESGGVPPQGEDFNGAMNQIARITWWLMAGGQFPYDSTFATNSNINGYPSGSRIGSADGLGTWISTADNNQNNPDTNGTNWVPGFQYGWTTIAGLSSSTVTLTPAQAAKNTIVLTGTLTANIQVIFPTWLKAWDVFNNTTGAFTVTAKTLSGAGVVLPQVNAVPTRIIGDGVNIDQLPTNIPPAVVGTNPLQVAQATGLQQCQLTLSGGNLVLNRYRGACVFSPGGGVVTIPSAGISLTPSGLTPATLYYVYLDPNSGSPALVVSTTGHSTDAATGVEVQTGNNKLVLVGMAWATGTSTWETTVRSWANDPGVQITAALASNASTASSTLTNVSTALQAFFLAWAGESAMGFCNATASVATANFALTIGPSLDNAAPPAIGGATPTVANQAVSISATSRFSNLSEGRHSINTFGAVSSGGGSLTFAGGNATTTNVLISSRS